MPFHVEVSRRALRDLAHISDFIQAEHSGHAAKWLNQLEAEVAKLAFSPRRHPKTAEDANLRQLLYGAKPHIYRVIFEIDAASHIVWVLHVRHGARRPFKAPLTR